MADVEQLKSEVEDLPTEDYIAFREWFTDRDQKKWDRQIEEDSESGKLDFLIKEAQDEVSDRSFADL